MSEIINVGILGATGNVGQKLIYLLRNHPFFRITDLVASERSAGFNYGERTHWREDCTMPEAVRNLMIKAPGEELEAKILFSGLDASVAGEVESLYAERGHIVVSNSKNHRMDTDVPLTIPEINGSELSIVNTQETFKKSGGFIVTNPNCSTIVLALALYPIYREFGLKSVMVTTMQAISGAGYPGISSMDILGNVFPTISGEEHKMETELLKIFSTADNTANFPVSASCNRVPVRDGHTMSIVFETEKKASREEILNIITTYPSLNLNSSPEDVTVYFDEASRPQPILDGLTGNGMTVSIGNLRESAVLDWKMTAFGHNTIRGAAGAAILNAELIVNKGLI